MDGGSTSNFLWWLWSNDGHRQPKICQLFARFIVSCGWLNNKMMLMLLVVVQKCLCNDNYFLQTPICISKCVENVWIPSTSKRNTCWYWLFLDENYTNAHKRSQKGHVLSESDKYTVHNYILFIMEFNGNVFKMRVQRQILLNIKTTFA